MAAKIDLTPPVVNLVLYSGDDSTFSLTAELDGDARDVTGTHLVQVKTNRNDSSALATMTVTVTDATTGECKFLLSSAAAATCLASVTPSTVASKTGLKTTGKVYKGEWDWQHVDALTTKLTYAQGQITIYEDISRP